MNVAYCHTCTVCTCMYYCFMYCLTSKNNRCSFTTWPASLNTCIKLCQISLLNCYHCNDYITFNS